VRWTSSGSARHPTPVATSSAARCRCGAVAPAALALPLVPQGGVDAAAREWVRHRRSNQSGSVSSCAGRGRSGPRAAPRGRVHQGAAVMHLRHPLKLLRRFRTCRDAPEGCRRTRPSGDRTPRRTTALAWPAKFIMSAQTRTSLRRSRRSNRRATTSAREASEHLESHLGAQALERRHRAERRVVVSAWFLRNLGPSAAMRIHHDPLNRRRGYHRRAAAGLTSRPDSARFTIGTHREQQ